MRISRRAFALALCLAFLGAAASDGSRARADVLERVVAVINDDAVFLSELRQRSMRDLASLASASSSEERDERRAQIFTQHLDELIDERLIAQAARRAQVSVNSSDVDRAIENAKRQSRLSETQFWQAVRQQGYTEPQFRESLRRQLIRLKLLNVRVRGRVNITDEDVRQVYDTEVRRARSRTTFIAADILVQITDPSATGLMRARREAEALRAQITSENFDEMMQEHGGFELGELHQGQLDAALEEVLLSLEEGGVSAPVQNAAGFHILLLRGRGQDAEQIPSFDQVRDAIHRHLMEEAMARQESVYLQELRRDANIRRML